jgi:uncharacterized lipoprotein
MKRFLFVGLLAVGLSACSLGSAVQSPALQGAALSASSSSVAQASSLKAAGDLYVIAVNAATAYLESAHADKSVERKITPVEAMLYAALINGQKAEKAGNSPAVAASISLFNSNYATLAGLIPGLK